MSYTFELNIPGLHTGSRAEGVVSGTPHKRKDPLVLLYGHSLLQPPSEDRMHTSRATKHASVQAHS
eukprot:1152683-Pelagomonas_calceolata.AAC.6